MIPGIVPKKLLVFFLLPLLTLASCSRCSLLGIEPASSRRSKPSEVTLLSWNVQNLFDDVDNGTEYYEFDPEKGEWDIELFYTKMLKISEVIEQSVKGGPDILLLQEVENENTLESLQMEILKGLHYSYGVMVESPGSAVNTGVLSRYPVRNIRSHGLFVEGQKSLRNVLEAEISVGEHSLIVFNNHWKSKLGGAEETEKIRIESAALIIRRVTEILTAIPEADIIVAGDLNENHDEYLRIAGAYTTALLPFSDDTEPGPGLWLADSPSLCSRLPGDGVLVLFSPWYGTDIPGSYYYKSSWETIDHFLLSAALFDDKGFRYHRFDVVSLPFMVNEQGVPMSWNSNTAGGYSDHLPLLLTLVL